MRIYSIIIHHHQIFFLNFAVKGLTVSLFFDNILYKAIYFIRKLNLIYHARCETNMAEVQICVYRRDAAVLADDDGAGVGDDVCLLCHGSGGYEVEIHLEYVLVQLSLLYLK